MRLQLKFLKPLAVFLATFGGYSAKAGPIFNYTGAVQAFTVTTTGTYEITAYGAQGGGGWTGFVNFATGGLGAYIDGDVFLTAGEVLQIVVGGQGGSGGIDGDNGGAGGGGSFVYVLGASQPIIVAGGGGGSQYAVGNGGSGQTGTSGQNGGYCVSGGAGGINGNGGAGCNNGDGGGAVPAGAAMAAPA